jgi:hypothetical protein
MKTIGLAAVILCGFALAANAQQVPCKNFYPVGEVAPPGCVKTFDRWGDGKAVAPSDKPHGSVLDEDAYYKTFYRKR